VPARKLRRPAEILLVEDNAREVELVRLALESCKLNHHLHVAEDGVRALAFLRRQGKYAKAVRPDLVLLDLKLPRKDGYEVLAEVKANGKLKVIPVVVLTTSDSDEDMLRCYALHANGYITKPSRFQELVRIMRSIDGFWFDVVFLPSESQ
jgi:two-component system response regulator